VRIYMLITLLLSCWPAAIVSYQLGSLAAASLAPPSQAVCRSKLVLMAGFGAPRAAAKKKPFGKKDFEQQMKSYNSCYVQGYPPPNAVDVYVHAEGKERFWFVGKANARADATSDYGLAVVVQKRHVLEHAKLLQPRELGVGKPTLELWCAPPNSEVKVAQRQQALRRLDGLKPGVDGLPSLTLTDVGFLPEQYDAESGKGFYVRLPPDGVPLGESEVKIMSPAQAAAGGYLDAPPAEDGAPAS